MAQSSKYFKIIVAAGLGFFLFSKIYLFQHLAYTSDLFMFLQMSRSWIEKGLFLQENCYAGQLPIHNYFLMPLFYLFTGWLGAYGLFLTLWSLIFFALYRLARAVSAPLLPILFLLPVAFWVCDHPNYGFGVELIQVPVSLLLALNLLQHRKKESLLWGTLLVLNKEDGVVLLASILISHHWSLYGFKEWTSLFKKIGFCLFIFAFGLIFQKTQGNRTTHVLSVFLNSLSNFGDIRNWIRGIKVCALLALPVFIFSIPKQWKRWLPIFIVGFAPLAIVGLIGGTEYGSEDWVHGIHWTIRYALVWGFVLSTLLFLTFRTTQTFNARKTSLSFLLIALTQIFVLAYYRNYYVWERVLPFAFADKLPIAALSAQEKKFFTCLSQNLKYRTPIAIEGPFFYYFHQQEIVWPDRIPNASQSPEISICAEVGRFYPEAMCRNPQKLLLSNLEVIERPGWQILSTTNQKILVQNCINVSGL